MGDRAAKIGLIINKHISDSKVFKKNPNYKYTSHMFKKSLTQRKFSEGVEKLKRNIQVKIGQKPGSSAIKHYIEE